MSVPDRLGLQRRPALRWRPVDRSPAGQGHSGGRPWAMPSDAGRARAAPSRGMPGGRRSGSPPGRQGEAGRSGPGWAGPKCVRAAAGVAGGARHTCLVYDIIFPIIVKIMYDITDMIWTMIS